MGGEPLLREDFPEIWAYNRAHFFDRADMFKTATNGSVPISDALVEVWRDYGEKIHIIVDNYGPELSPLAEENVEKLRRNGIDCELRDMYSEKRHFGGWVDFGPWEPQGQGPGTLAERFASCAVTRDMHGNWRTRDGKVHWCSRSQRGMELGLIPDCPEDYVDLFESTTVAEKREKFCRIAGAAHLSACDRCSGDAGTGDAQKRYSAAEQL